MMKIWESIRMDAGYELSCGPNSRIKIIRVYTECIWGRIGYGILRIVCRWKGHRWVDTGHAGPDSGSMGANCTRCGDGWHITLY